MGLSWPVIELVYPVFVIEPVYLLCAVGGEAEETVNDLDIRIENREIQ
jgi:hypothetical protein